MDFSNVSSLNIGDSEVVKLKINDNVVYHKPMEFVDLGLTDSEGNHILWSTYNLGALSPYDRGWILSWGELGTEEGYEDGIKTAGYGQGNYKFYDVESGAYTKYSSSTISTLEAEDDAVTQALGSEYRMATRDEWGALLNTENFTIEGDSVGKGIRITSKIEGYEGNSIFIYACGMGENLSSEGSTGLYWTSSVNNGWQGWAYRVSIYPSGSYDNANASQRIYGRGIRPVKIVPSV